MEEKEIYGREYCMIKGWTNEQFGYANHTDRKLYEMLLEKYNMEGELLEIGFGNGGFAKTCKDHNINWTGVEINKELTNTARQLQYKCYESIEQIDIDNRFDRIVMLDVLEHLKKGEIITLIRECYLRLNINGLIILRFPNGDSPFGRHSQYSDWTHETVLTETRIKDAVKQYNLVIVESYGDPLLIPGIKKIKFIKRLIIASTRWLIEIFINNIFHGGEQKSIYPNIIMVLKKYK